VSNPTCMSFVSPSTLPSIIHTNVPSIDLSSTSSEIVIIIE
jgi:hypothetical protein